MNIFSATAVTAVTLLLSSCSGFHKEPLTPVSVYETYDSEFLYWCAEEGVWPVYGEVPADCAPDRVSRGEWDHLPITVNAEQSLQAEVLVAVDSFNDQVGFELFAYQSGNMEPDIGVMVFGAKPWVAAEAKHISIDGVHKGAVLVYNGIEGKDREDIMLHELGHLVGLRHDSGSKHSIMYPTIAYRVARLESKDVKALRAVYGK